MSHEPPHVPTASLDRPSVARVVLLTPSARLEGEVELGPSPRGKIRFLDLLNGAAVDGRAPSGSGIVLRNAIRYPREGHDPIPCALELFVPTRCVAAAWDLGPNRPRIDVGYEKRRGADLATRFQMILSAELWIEATVRTKALVPGTSGGGGRFVAGTEVLLIDLRAGTSPSFIPFVAVNQDMLEAWGHLPAVVGELLQKSA